MSVPCIIVSQHQSGDTKKCKNGRVLGPTTIPGSSPEPEPELIEIFSDSESDCGYTGGVDYHGFDSDDEFEPGSDGCWSDSGGYPPLGAPHVQVDGGLQIRTWHS